MHRPSTVVVVRDLTRMGDFFRRLAWDVTDLSTATAIVATPSGAFRLTTDRDADAADLEFALDLPDPLMVDALAEAVADAGGIVMEPPQ